MTRTQSLIDEIQRPNSTRDSIARVYAQGINEHVLGAAHDFVDWPTVNSLLLKRYAVSGLNYIKARAWKMVAA